MKIQNLHTVNSFKSFLFKTTRNQNEKAYEHCQKVLNLEWYNDCGRTAAVVQDGGRIDSLPSGVKMVFNIFW